jgi:hypothetical protein
MLAMMTATVGADQDASIVRRGYFAELTDTESASFQIHHFRMTADGSRIVYFGWNGSYNELRLIDGDGSGDTLIEEAVQHQGLLNGLYDISDDGSKVVYFRYTSLADPSPEIVVYDVATTTTTLLLKSLPVSNYGTPENWTINPQNGTTLVRLSGDGTKLFFINRFGPFHGSPESGFTIYRVNTDGSGVIPVLQTSQIASIPGIGADTYSVIPFEGEIATNETGSKFAIALAGTYGETDLVTMDGDGTNPAVIQDVRDGKFHGPSMSGDGTRIAYSRGGTTDPADTGIFVTNLGLPQSPVRVEPDSGYWGVYPHISSDGGSVVYNFDLGGGSSPSVRWAASTGALRLPVTHPVVTAYGGNMVATGGDTVVFMGTTTRWGYRELMRFDFDSTPFASMPAVDAVSGSPDMSIAIGTDPYTFYYSTTGDDLREMWSWPFTDDPALLQFSGFSGFSHGGYLYDDGAGGDVTAGDGIFTDDAIYATLPPPDGLELFTVRAGVATDNGTAAFADYLCTFGDRYDELFSDGFESGDTSAWSQSVD